MQCHDLARNNQGAQQCTTPLLQRRFAPWFATSTERKRKRGRAREREREHSQQLQCPIIAIYSCRSSMIVSFSDPYICLNLIPTLHMTIRLSQFCRSAAAAAGPWGAHVAHRSVKSCSWQHPALHLVPWRSSMFHFSSRPLKLFTEQFLVNFRLLCAYGS